MGYREPKLDKEKSCNDAGRYRSLVWLILSAVLLSGGCLFAQSAYTSNVSATSITLSVPTTALSVDLNPSSNSGFAKSSTSAVSVKTDVGWGYDFSIKSKTDSNALKNEISGGLLESITIPAGGIDEETFKSGVEYNNKWGFLPSKLNSTTNEKYQAGPTDAPLIIDRTSVASDNATSYDITIAARVDNMVAVDADNAVVAGNYTNTFVLTATANTVSYSITYNLNSGSWDGANQSGNTTNKTITLDTHAPTRDGYEFKGWCDQPTTDETCSGNQYSAGGTYALSSGSNIVTLYAMWKKMPLLTDLVTIDSGVTQVTFKAGTGIEMIMVADQNGRGENYWSPSYGDATMDVVLPNAGGKNIVITVVPESGYILDSWTRTTGSSQTWTANGKSGNYKNMKDVTASECLAAGETGMNVTDERNGVSYTIGKFDKRCWMFSNLRLEAGTTLNPTTSDVSSNFTLPSEADSNAWANNNGDYYGKKNMKACKGLLGYNSTSEGNTCTDQTNTVTEYLYNWYAAIANPYESSNPTGYSDLTEAVDNKSLGSICPKNWHLVTISDDLDINNLEVKTWNASKATNPGRLVSCGGFRTSAQNAVGRRGTWWASSRYSNNLARIVFILQGTADSNQSLKYSGNPIRCVR